MDEIWRSHEEMLECSTWSKKKPKYSKGNDDSSKKLDHNAKERIRRMKLNASYLALRALLPNSTRSKKKWSAPAIVDKVLKHIPELENEVESLRRLKDNAKGNINIISNGGGGGYENERPTICLNRVNEAEAIIQVCMGIQAGDSQFTAFLQTLEDDEAIIINSASAIHVSHTRICHHLHIQISNTASTADHHFQELLDKANSWLR